MTTRPLIDATAALAYLATLPPIARITAADEYGDDARALVGELARIRRAAIAEAHARHEPLDLSDASIREAVRPDKELLTTALQLILERDATNVRREQLAQGLGPRVALAVVARRVGLAHADQYRDHFSEEEWELIAAAVARAREILPPQQ